MVVSCKDDDCYQVTLIPNRSATWAQNRIILMGIAILVFIIAVGWSVVGAWVILPFAGLEVGLLAYFVHKTSSKSYRQEVLILEGDEVRLEKGSRTPEWQTSCGRHDCEVVITHPRHSLSPAAISIRHGDDSIALGRFLNKDDTDQLIDVIRDMGLRYRFRGQTAVHAIEGFDLR